MSNEEVAYKLLELYYTNCGIFKSYCLSLKDLTNKYVSILEILRGGNNE